MDKTSSLLATFLNSHARFSPLINRFDQPKANITASQANLSGSQNLLSSRESLDRKGHNLLFQPEAIECDECSGSVAIIEIIGYSKLLQIMAEETTSAANIEDYLESYFAKIIDLIAASNGDIVQIEGDLITVAWRTQRQLWNEMRSLYSTSVKIALLCCLSIREFILQKSILHLALEDLKIAHIIDEISFKCSIGYGSIYDSIVGTSGIKIIHTLLGTATENALRVFSSEQLAPGEIATQLIEEIILGIEFTNKGDFCIVSNDQRVSKETTDKNYHSSIHKFTAKDSSENDKNDHTQYSTYLGEHLWSILKNLYSADNNQRSSTANSSLSKKFVLSIKLNLLGGFGNSKKSCTDLSSHIYNLAQIIERECSATTKVQLYTYKLLSFRIVQFTCVANYSENTDQDFEKQILVLAALSIRRTFEKLGIAETSDPHYYILMGEVYEGLLVNKYRSFWRLVYYNPQKARVEAIMNQNDASKYQNQIVCDQATFQACKGSYLEGYFSPQNIDAEREEIFYFIGNCVANYDRKSLSNGIAFQLAFLNEVIGGDSSKNIISIEGNSGTGKTYTIEMMMQTLAQKSYKYAITNSVDVFCNDVALNIQKAIVSIIDTFSATL